VNTCVRIIAGGSALLLLLAGCTADENESAQPTTMKAQSTESTQKSFEEVVRDVLPSVVQIDTSQGLGSGVVYDDDGHIVTNAHVIGRARTFEVTFATGGNPMPASLVASYPPDDLAVIKVDGELPVDPASFGDSSKLAVGELVLAMGSPLGLSASVSDGIVSATGRAVSEPASETSPGTTIPDMVQTSAAINPGNSGGALVDMDKRVIGIPTLAATDSQLGGAAPGIGFAISSNTVKRIADQIVKDGRVTNSGRAALNITARTVADSQGEAVGVGVVDVTADGAAAKAGIRPGDVITEVDGDQTTSVAGLNQVLVSLKPGDEVAVTFLRDSETEEARVTLGELGG
jgi:putative serine protease PepD